VPCPDRTIHPLPLSGKEKTEKEEKEMSFQVLICEKCSLIHPLDYDGLTCRQPECDGKLIPTSIFFPTEGEQLPLPEDPPIIAS